MANILIIFAFIAILLSLLYGLRMHQEKYVNPQNNTDSLLDYYDYISLPGRSYSNVTLPQEPDENIHKYFLEFNDLFFEGAFSECKTTLTKDDAANIDALLKTDDIKKTLKDSLVTTLKQAVANVVASCLNKKLDSNETVLFSAVDIFLVDVKRDIQTNTFLVKSKSTIHRVGKAYGAIVSTTTYHSLDKTILTDYILHGFAFEDAIQAHVVPSNLLNDTTASYSNLSDDTIIKDKKYEDTVMCKYIDDMKRFRNIDITSSSGNQSLSNTICEGKSSSTSFASELSPTI